MYTMIQLGQMVLKGVNWVPPGEINITLFHQLHIYFPC